MVNLGQLVKVDEGKYDIKKQRCALNIYHRDHFCEGIQKGKQTADLLYNIPYTYI